MTIKEAAIQMNVCLYCDLGFEAHWAGTLDGFGVVHYADRRFSRRALRNMLLLVAKRERMADVEFLNLPIFEFFYLYSDNVMASKWAVALGVRLPARLSRLDRLRCLSLAKRQGAKLSKRSAVYKWAHDT